jgi:hypothetical protein
MFAQTLVVAALVAGCFVYVVWVLMPQALRRSVAVVLTRQSILARWAPLRRAANQSDTGCSCDGCDKGTKPAGSTNTAVIRVVPRSRL